MCIRDSARPVLALLEERLGRGGRVTTTVTGLEPPARAWLDAIPSGGAVLAVALGRDSRVAQAAVTAARAAGAPAAVLVDSGLSALAPATARGGLTAVNAG